jgi:predicted nucleotidyltransferase component of viral defense system
MIKQWIESYKPQHVLETEQALREILQEITLAGLYRANFFKHAAFYGGTALRIFHGLNRFSEDLDFSLLEKNKQFELEPYFKYVIDEFESLGIHVSLHQKIKSSESNIDSAFLKSDTLWSELVIEKTIPQLNLSIKPSIKIKIEVDTNPPLLFSTENRLLTKPFSFYVNCLTLPDLFAGKMHALLFRKWKTRVKGRDWYDFEWYVKMGIDLNLKHFCQRAQESGDWPEKTITQEELINLINLKISEVDMSRVKEDVIRFIPNPALLDIWSPTYFNQLCVKLKVI